MLQNKAIIIIECNKYTRIVDFSVEYVQETVNMISNNIYYNCDLSNNNIRNKNNVIC